jgi:hypothetical protein
MTTDLINKIVGADNKQEFEQQFLKMYNLHRNWCNALLQLN